MRRTFVCLSCLVVIIACGDSRPSPTPTSPTSPTPTTITAAPCPPCPAPGAYALSGVVRAAGAQIAGAKVGLVKLGPQAPISRGPEELIASVMTDGQGSYSFPRVENVSFSGALVSVSKPGYFTDTKYVQMSADRQFDFELERSVSTFRSAKSSLLRLGTHAARASGTAGWAARCVGALSWLSVHRERSRSPCRRGSDPTSTSVFYDQTGL